jgi:hypothetical protein
MMGCDCGGGGGGIDFRVNYLVVIFWLLAWMR